MLLFALGIPDQKNCAQQQHVAECALLQTQLCTKFNTSAHSHQQLLRTCAVAMQVPGLKFTRVTSPVLHKHATFHKAPRVQKH